VLALPLAHPESRPINIIPLNQPPLLKTFPPKPEEQTRPGTGKFVIFTRESLRKPKRWDFIAGAWELIPSKPNVPITKRVEFCHSSWEARPLLDTLVNDERNRDQYPRFVRLQVDASTNFNYSVNLYDINYRTWETRCVWQGSRLGAFGVTKATVICENLDEWLSLDALTGTVRREVPLIPVAIDAPYWIVRKSGEKAGVWSFNPTNGEYIGHFGDVELPAGGYVETAITADGRTRALVLATVSDEWTGGLLNGIMVVQRDDHAEDIHVPIALDARAGSGVRVIPTGTSLAVTPDGKIEFSALTKTTGTNDRVWSVEIASGKILQSSCPHRKRPGPDFAIFDGVPTPAYLRPLLPSLTYFGRGGVAVAFLMHKGVLNKDPGYANCEAGVSPDGLHILYKAKEGPLSDFFIYGDLQTQQTVRWKKPGAIHRDDSMEFVWVETP